MSSNEGSELQNDRNEACTLKCENGSTCSFKGPSLWGQKDGMHCVCTTGFAGVRCELSASVCGAGEHVCLNGSACVKDGNEYKCECEQNDASFNICPHRRTEFCTPVPPHIEYYDGMAVAAFCVNDGICADVLIRNQVYPVCKCPALYTGPHCEFLKSDDPNPTSPEVDNNTKADSHMRKAGLIVVLVFVLGILILIGLFTRRKIRRTRKRKQQEVTSTNLQGFRDGGTDSNINFAVSSNRSRPSKLISAIVDPRRHMRRKNSFNSTDSLNRVTRQPISDQEKYRTGSFYRRGNQRSAVFEASNQLVLQSSDAPKKGKLFDVQFV